MPAKQKVKKTKPSKPVRDEMMDAFDSIVGGDVEAIVDKTSTTTEKTGKTKKRGNADGLRKAQLNRKPKSEMLINVLGRKYTKPELHSKALQASGKTLIPDTVLRDNIKRVLHSEKFVELLPSQQKSYSFGSKALPILKEHMDFQLTNLLYIANVIAVSKGKTTIGEGDILLASLIMRGKLNIHGDKTKTQDALIKSQTKAKRETINLGQDVNIDKIAMILQDALSTKADSEITRSALFGSTTDKLKEAIAQAEEKFHDVGSEPITKKRKLEQIETKEEDKEVEEEQEEPAKEEPIKKAPVKKSTKEDKKDEDESKTKKKKIETKKVTKK